MTIDNHSLAPMIIPENYPEPITKSPPPKPMGVVSYTFLLAINGIAKTCYHLAKPPRHMVPVDIFRARLTTTFPELRKRLSKLKRQWNPNVMDWLQRELERLGLQERCIRTILTCPKKTFWQMGEQDVSHTLHDFIERISVLNEVGEILLGIQYLLEESHHEFGTRQGNNSQNYSPEWNEWVVDVRRLTPPDLEIEPEWREAKTLLEEGSALFTEAEQEEYRKHREEIPPPRILEPKTIEDDLIDPDTAEVIIVSGVQVYCQNGKTAPYLIREARENFRAKESFISEWRAELLARKNDPHALADFLLGINALPILANDLSHMIIEMETFHEYDEEWFLDLCRETIEEFPNLTDALQEVITELQEKGHTRYEHRRIQRILKTFMPEPLTDQTQTSPPSPQTLDVEALAEEAVEIWLKNRKGLQQNLSEKLGYFVSFLVFHFPLGTIYGEATAETIRDSAVSLLREPDAESRYFGEAPRRAVQKTNAYRRGEYSGVIPEGILPESTIYHTVIAFAEQEPMETPCTHAQEEHCLCTPFVGHTTGGRV